MAPTQLFRIIREWTKACFALSDLAVLLLLLLLLWEVKGGHGLLAGGYPWELTGREVSVSAKLLTSSPHGHRPGQKHGVRGGSWGSEPSFTAHPPAA